MSLRQAVVYGNTNSFQAFNSLPEIPLLSATMFLFVIYYFLLLDNIQVGNLSEGIATESMTADVSKPFSCHTNQ